MVFNISISDIEHQYQQYQPYRGYRPIVGLISYRVPQNSYNIADINRDGLIFEAMVLSIPGVGVKSMI